MKDAKEVVILMVLLQLIKHENDKSLNTKSIKLYQKVLDLLLYLTNGTRYNILIACQYFVQYMSHLFISHKKGIK